MTQLFLFSKPGTDYKHRIDLVIVESSFQDYGFGLWTQHQQLANETTSQPQLIFSGTAAANGTLQQFHFFLYPQLIQNGSIDGMNVVPSSNEK